MAFMIKPTAQYGAQLQSADSLVILDATLSDSVSGRVSWTSHPIEDGSQIQDHAVDEPDSITVTGLLTRAPFASMQDATSPTRVEDAIARLFSMLRAHQPVTLTTGLWRRTSLGITSVSVQRDGVASGHAPRVTIELQHVIVTSAKTGALAPAQVAADKRASASSEVDAGTQSATESDGAEERAQVKRSVLRAGADYLTLTGG